MHSMTIRTVTRGLAVLIMLAALLLPNGATQAASTYTVNSNGDTNDAKPGDNICRDSAGKCTLRAAIQEATAHPGVDTINIPAMTIVVHSELRITSKSGDDRGVIINGAGQASTIIDGNAQTRVFYFGALTSKSHAISNLTIRNGKNTFTEAVRERNGGAIFNESAGLKLTNVTLTSNRAYEGGGLYNHRPTTNNVPTVTLNNVVINSNLATAAVSGAGGGGVANGGVITGDKVYIRGNHANSQGGGWYNNSYQQVTLVHFEISGNSAYMGAGMDDDIGPISLDAGKIFSNEAPCCMPASPDGSKHHSAGGGIYNNKGDIKISRTEIYSNKVSEAKGLGGGIVNIQSMTLTNVSVTGNRATYGAGVYNGNYASIPNSLTMTNTTISSNIGLDSAGVNSIGGGIFNLNNIKAMNSTIARNIAFNGGGIEIRGTAPVVTLVNTILATNTDSASAPNCHTDGTLTMTSGGHNLFGSTSGCRLKTATGDLVNKDPLILGMTGSYPLYHPIRPGSPAIDKGTNTGCPAKDARGVVRPTGSACDIGAFEYTAPAAQLFLTFMSRSS